MSAPADPRFGGLLIADLKWLDRAIAAYMHGDKSAFHRDGLAEVENSVQADHDLRGLLKVSSQLRHKRNHFRTLHLAARRVFKRQFGRRGDSQPATTGTTVTITLGGYRRRQNDGGETGPQAVGDHCRKGVSVDEVEVDLVDRSGNLHAHLRLTHKTSSSVGVVCRSSEPTEEGPHGHWPAGGNKKAASCSNS